MSEKSRRSIDTIEKLSENVEPSDKQWQTNDETAKKHANSSVLICRRYLKLLGIWRLNVDGKLSWKLLVSNFLTLVCFYGLVIRTVPMIFYLILDTKHRLQRWHTISRLVFCLMSWSKYAFLKLNRRNIEKCMEHIELDWLKVGNTASRDIMLKYSRYGLLVTKICVVFTYTGATWLSTLPHVLKKSANSAARNDNATQVAPVRLFTIPSHFGFAAATETPVYEVLFTSQIVATYMMHSIAIASYSVAVVTVMHACGQLKILMEKIRNLVDDEGRVLDYSHTDKKLSDIISHHVKILRFISRAEKMLRGICLTELGGCTLGMCFTGYFGLLEWKKEHTNFIVIIIYVTLIITFTFDIFSFCVIGELLTQECARVGEIAYMIDWYRLPGKQPLALCLIMTMAQIPVTLTAGGAVQLSFRCFASAVKTALGYLNMFRTVMD